MTTLKTNLFKPGDRVLIDIWGSYTEKVNCTVPGTIIFLEKNQYYVCPDFLSPCYVWHHCVIAEPESSVPLYYLINTDDGSGNDDGIISKRRMCHNDAILSNQRLEGSGKMWVISHK